MDSIKEYQRCINFIYNLNDCREGIHESLVSSNKLNKIRTKKMLMLLREHLLKTLHGDMDVLLDKTIIIILNHEFEYNTLIKTYFCKTNIIKFKHGHDYIRKLHDTYVYSLTMTSIELYGKKYIHDHFHYYLKFVVNDKPDFYNKMFYEYFYTTCIYNLNNKRNIKNEVNMYIDNISKKYRYVKAYQFQDNVFIGSLITLFSSFVSHKYNNVYKITSSINLKRNIIQNIIYEKINYDKVSINKIGVIKPVGCLCVNNNDKIMLSDKYFNPEMRLLNYEHIGLLVYKNHYDAVTLDHLIVYMNKFDESDDRCKYYMNILDRSLFILIYSLYRILIYYPNFRHNDLHFKNIIVNFKKNNKFYLFDRVVYYVDDVDLKIIDFELTTLGDKYLLNTHINNCELHNTYGLGNFHNNFYDIHYILNILYIYSKFDRYKNFVLRHITNKSLLCNKSVYVNNWRLKKGVFPNINIKRILKDKLFNDLRILKFMK